VRIVEQAAIVTSAKDFVANYTGGPGVSQKKICSYFSDAMMCLGPVATDQVVSAVEHTAGEKRLSGHPDDFLRMK